MFVLTALPPSSLPSLLLCSHLLPSFPPSLPHSLVFPPSLLPQDDAAAAQWYSVEEPPSLAFDHKVVIREAFDKIAALDTVKDNGE